MAYSADDLYRYERMGLRCPTCGAALHLTIAGTTVQVWCRDALGEIAWDDVRRVRYLPQDSEHARYEWRLSDAMVSRQIERYESREGKLAA